MKLLLFGMLAEDTGSAELEMEMPKDVGALREALLIKFPALAGRQFMIAVNKQKADNNLVLNEDDEIALIPPFAGG